MAKEKTAAKAETTKKVRVKKEGPKTVQLELSTEGNSSIKQSVSHVRSVGVLVTTTLLNTKGEAIGIATTWVPGLKPKSKAGQRFLVEDKGPKPKKEKSAKNEKTEKKK